MCLLLVWKSPRLHIGLFTLTICERCKDAGCCYSSRVIVCAAFAVIVVKVQWISFLPVQLPLYMTTWDPAQERVVLL
jgi:hypothetical protein